MRFPSFWKIIAPLRRGRPSCVSELNSQTDHHINIGLFWHSVNSANLGVGALTIANMALAREAAIALGLTPQFHVIGMGDDEPVYVTPDQASMFAVSARSLISPWGVWAQIGRLDCVLDIGAGDSFADIYGFKRFFYLWVTKVLVVLRGVPLLLCPQTIGPFTRTPYRQMAAWILSHSWRTVARDQMSLDALRALSPRTKAELAVDVAFALPFEDRRSGATNSPVRVGVNVSGLLFNEANSGRNRFGLDYDYADLMRELISAIATRPDVEVHLLTHVASTRGGRDDDGGVANDLVRAMPNLVRVPDFASPSEAKSYISGLDFLVSGRMHACIAAFSAGIPVVPVAYSRKFSGLFGMLGYNWLLPVTGMNRDQALAYLLNAFERRAELAADIKPGMGRAESLLDGYKRILRELFAEVSAKV